MMIEYRKFITRSMLKAEPDKLFVFGDNMERRGFGGQAKEMRGEFNAVGIPTKWRPTMDSTAFFVDSDYEVWFEEAIGDYLKLYAFSVQNSTVVWPKDGIGSGRARLKVSAPRIYNRIKNWEQHIAYEGGKLLW